MTKGPSNVTLTLTFHLDLKQGQRRSKFSKKVNFIEQCRVVRQVKGFGLLIRRHGIFCPYDVTGRNNNDVIMNVKIIYLVITSVVIVIDTSR